MKIGRYLTMTLGLFLAGTIGLVAQVEGEEQTAGSGVIEVVGEFNWGTVAPGTLEAEIPIKNVGDGPLQIDHVKPSCGCTAAPLDDYLLDPGQTTMMHVSVNAPREGLFSKSIVIYSDDPNNQTTIIRLVAEVQSEIGFEPDVQYLIFQNATVGQETTASVRVTNKGKEAITIYPPEVANASSEISFNLTGEKVLKPGEDFLLVATTTPESETPISATATFRTSAPNTPTREFKLYGHVTEVSTTESTDQVPAAELSGAQQ